MHRQPSHDQPKESMFRTVWIPLGSLLVAALGLLARDAPPWITATIVGYIVLVAVAVLIPFFRRIGQWLRQKTLGRSLAAKFYPQLGQTVTVLLPQLEESRVETICQVWWSISSWDEAKQIVRVDHAHLRTLQVWLDSIARRLETQSKAAFVELADELGDLILQYQWFCEEAYRQLDALASSGSLQPQKLRSLKQEWNQVRDKHNQTIKSWEDTAKNINAMAHERICLDHYSSLKTLE